MRCKQVRQHQKKAEKQVYEIWSNQVRRNRPNLIDKIRSEKSRDIPSLPDFSDCWGVAQPL